MNELANAWTPESVFWVFLLAFLFVGSVGLFNERGRP